jgi:hydrogenase maturation protease
MSRVADQEPERNVTLGTVVRDTLIVGVGNPLRGDDGVGTTVARALAERDLPAGVEVVDGGTQGLGLVSVMEGRQRVILVDAADVGRVPGQFVRFALDEAHLRGDDQPLSVHAAGLREALLLAQALGVLPDQVIIFGVQPARVDWDDALSPEIEAALPALVEAVLAEALHGGRLAKTDGDSQPE